MTPQEKAKDIESKNYEWSSDDVIWLIARIYQLEKLVKASENFMYHGLLEMSAWMGIPEKKRESQVKEILSNYQYAVREILSVDPLQEKGETK